MSADFVTNHPPPYGITEPGGRGVRAVCVSHSEEDHVLLRQVFNHSKWLMRAARSRREAVRCLSEWPANVVLCDERLPDGTWRDLLEDTARLPDSPPLVVTARSADDSLWGEVLNLGAYDLLIKPFDASEIVHVVSLAWRHWRNAMERAMPRRELRLAAG